MLYASDLRSVFTVDLAAPAGARGVRGATAARLLGLAGGQEVQLHVNGTDSPCSPILALPAGARRAGGPALREWHGEGGDGSRRPTCRCLWGTAQPSQGHVRGPMGEPVDCGRRQLQHQARVCKDRCVRGVTGQ